MENIKNNKELTEEDKNNIDEMFSRYFNNECIPPSILFELKLISISIGILCTHEMESKEEDEFFDYIDKLESGLSKRIKILIDCLKERRNNK